uniref:Dynactin subunit 1-like n=1 Tax=Saccoglossus kowalevskii TaxID=10224 RepID=A0ABM0MVZ4_SACKO|nr:PREDICTED: dynactin subunit 1-like [Saccoglossus kowalevskii]
MDMYDTFHLQSILHSIEEISDKNISLIRDIETIEGKANEQDATQLIDSLKEHLKASQETNAQLQKTLQSQSTALKEDLEKLQKQHEAAEKGQMEPGELSNQEKELTLQLKSQMAKNVELQNGRLKTELALHERIEALKLMSQTNKRLQADVNTSRSNSQKLLKLFDKRAKEAERRLTEMEEELKRTQENAKKYQDLYETEKRKRQIKAKSDGEGDGSQDKQE